MNPDLIAQLERNALFYQRESEALAANEDRRDRRRLGWREAATISKLLSDAVQEMKATA